MSDSKKLPNMPLSHWHRLRNQFKKSIPGSITTNYISSVLGMSVGSARTNILPTLKAIGMIDENDNVDQEKAKQFRDDEQYPKFCKNLIDELYPNGLKDAFPDKDSDREGIKSWIMNDSGVGSSAAGRYATFYLELLQANVNYEVPPKKNISNSNSKKEDKKNTGAKEKANANNQNANKNKVKPENANSPSLNINLQIHISSDATPDQIEKIFESMSKHIYKNN